MRKYNICNDCHTAFSVNPPVHEKAYRMNARLDCPAGCDCENAMVSQFSPFPVDGAEELAACVSHPDHTENDELSPKVLDRAFTQGLSVTRTSIAPEGMPGVVAFCQFIDEKKPNVDSMGIVTFIACEVREVLFKDETRAFSVFDTALKKAQEHADIVARRYHGGTKGLSAEEKKDRNWAKQQLFEIIRSKHLTLPSLQPTG